MMRLRGGYVSDRLALQGSSRRVADPMRRGVPAFMVGFSLLLGGSTCS